MCPPRSLHWWKQLVNVNMFIASHPQLTHWGRVTHICVSKLTIIGSDNGLSPDRRQAIIWTNAGILSIGPLGTKLSEILIGIHIFSFTKMHLKMSSGTWQPSCLGPNLPERTKVRPWGRLRVRIHSIEKTWSWKFYSAAQNFTNRMLYWEYAVLKQYSCNESATIWYIDHQYLAQYTKIMKNLPEMPLIFCNYAVRSCGTWRKGPGQSPCNVLWISDLELYVTETSMGVCDPVTD